MHIHIGAVFAEHPAAEEITRRLEGAGYRSVLVGGVVRDGVLAVRERCAWVPKDVDIATEAPPERVLELLKGFKTLQVGKAFGVVVVVAPDGRRYEVATFRTEGDYPDGRHPQEVRWGTLEDDVKRRDFTVNGLVAARDGQVMDLVGGLADIERGIIRTIGSPDRRLSEDRLRMLRAVRFSCQLGFGIDKATEDAVCRHAQAITQVSWERIGDEFLRLLATPRSAMGIRLLHATGLLSRILPEVATLDGVPQSEVYHPEGDVFAHTCAALEVADGLWDDPYLKLGILLHDVGKPVALERWFGEHMSGHCRLGAKIAEEALRRLRLPARQVNGVVHLVREHMRAARLQDMGLGKQLRLLSVSECPGASYDDLDKRYPLFADLVRLMICDAEGSAHKASAWKPLLAHVVGLLVHVERLQGVQRARQLLNGDDLVALGMSPGPQLGRVLEEIHELVLGGVVRTRQEALAEAARRVSGHV